MDISFETRICWVAGVGVGDMSACSCFAGERHGADTSDYSVGDDLCFLSLAC